MAKKHKKHHKKGRKSESSVASETGPSTIGGDDDEESQMTDQDQQEPTRSSPDIDPKGVQKNQYPETAAVDQGPPPPRRSGNCCSAAFRKISLVIWKNLLLRKRHYIVTILEILLPLVFTAFLCLQASSTEPKPGMRLGSGTFSGYKERNFSKLTFSEDEEKEAINYTLFYIPKKDASVEGVVKNLQSLEQLTLEGKESEDQIRQDVGKYSYKRLLTGTPQATLVLKDLGPVLQKKSGTLGYGIRFFARIGSRPQAPKNKSDNSSQQREPWPPLQSHENLARIQQALDKALIMTLTGVDQSKPSITFKYHKMEMHDEDEVGTGGDNSNGDPFSAKGSLVTSVLGVGFIFIIPSILQGVLTEKETGIKELMKLSGIPNWIHWFAWTANFVVIFTITVSIVTFVLFQVGPGDKLRFLWHCNPLLCWTILWLYLWASMSFCFFLSSFFQKPVIAVIIGMLFWVLTALVPGILLGRSYNDVVLPGKLGIALMPNGALFLAFRVIFKLELEHEGADWGNLFTRFDNKDTLTLGLVIVMLGVDIVLYLLLTLYLEAVLPSEYGVRRPLYFLFTPSFWGCESKKKVSSSKVGQDLGVDLDEDNSAFEQEPEGLTIGVEIKNMRKLFGKHAAVDGVSLKMFDGEIFALLGHNGAGKTTTISICTGMMAPTSGTAIINGFDIVTQMDLVREKIGICPQHNLVFYDLTVDENLKFFGKLKGMSSAEAQRERMEMLRKLQLTEKTHIMAKKLSGGQKRKLCLGISLIGNAKVVFLDEPTSGMDVEARRAIWDLLLFERGHRTIILTTHFMEEADVLGDRIGIMAHGKVQCCGTSAFLKRYYGTGYTLSMTMSDISQDKRNSVLSTVQALVPSATVKEDALNATPDELDISLPTEACSTSTFSKIFKSLQDKKQSLGIKTFGLSLTNLDEVFVKVDEAYSNSSKKKTLELIPIPTATTVVARTTTAEDNEATALVQDETKPIDDPDNAAMDLEGVQTNRVQGVSLIGLQFSSFLIKRFHYTRRNGKLFFAQILMPVLLVLSAVLIVNSLLPDLPKKNEQRERKFGLDAYPKGNLTYYRDGTGNFNDKTMQEIIGPTSKRLDGPGTFESALEKKSFENKQAFFNKNLIAFEITANNEIHVYYRAHVKSYAQNMASNILLRLISLNSANQTIKDINVRLEMTELPPIVELDEGDLANILTMVPIHARIGAGTFGMLLSLGLGILAATFIVAPMEEKICNGKQLQLMTGASPAIYWAASFLWDWIVMVVVATLMVVTLVLLEHKDSNWIGTYTINGGFGVLFLILVLFAYAAVPFSYLFSLFMPTVTRGFVMLVVIHYVTSEIAGLSNNFEGTRDPSWMHIVAIVLRVICSVAPNFGSTICIQKYVTIALRKSRCRFLPSNNEELFCTEKNLDWATPKAADGNKADVYQCCKNCSLLSLSPNCVEKVGYITFWMDKPGIFGKIEKVPGLGQELLYIFLLGSLYHVILILWEVLIGPKLRDKVMTKDTSHEPNVDQDVEEEAQRIMQLVEEKRLTEDALVIQNLSRNFGTFAAVKDVNFGLHYGECFGLLGVNGAGKTTAFRMLTGDESRSSGNAYASGCDLKTSKKRFLGKIGYCPQFDGIVGVLTGLEMVQLFARLRGVKRVTEESKRWMVRVGLTESENVQCRKYSGGMKRRLSAAMALVGDPEILLLDEPTTGVDPVSRREFWKIILSTKAEGRAVILTSHSMDEIAACCTRLAIMVNGQLQCLGGVQYLKNKFAQGFSLDLKINSTPGSEAELASLDREIQDKLAPCSLKDSHGTAMQYHIEDPLAPWDVLFSRMEEIKAKYPTLIDDYSISETTLEQVFLAFARMQYPPRAAQVGGRPKCFGI